MLDRAIDRRLRSGTLSGRDLLELQQFAQSPAFNLSTTGAGVETTFAAAVAPTFWLSCTDVTFTGTNNWIERTSARGDVGREEAATGEFSGAGTLTFDGEPDTLGPMLAIGIGTEQVVANAGNPTATTVNTTTTAPVAPGSYVPVPLTAVTGVSVGDWYTIDTAGNLETQQVASISGNTATFYTITKTHASGVAVVNAAVPLAYDHTYTLGSPRRTLTFQRNRRTDAVNYVGNKIATMDFTAANRQILAVRATTTYANEANVASPATAAYSVLNPFRFNDPGDAVTLAGVAADAGVLGWSLTVNNGLLAPEFTFGGGRFPTGIPEGQARVSGNMSLQFTTPTAQQRFWGAPAATGPQSVVQPVTLAFTWLGSNYINRVVKYGLVITMPKVKFTTVPVAGRGGGLLNQAVTFEAFSTGLQTNDDAKFVLTNTQSAAT